MASQEIIKPKTTEDEKELLTLKVLKVVRDAQVAHGLRHNDYQLYRQYCTRRIHRLRKSVGLTQGRKKFQLRMVKAEDVKDDRHLLISLMCTERCWAYAMQLKEESMQEIRKKYGMRNKLKKANKYVQYFEKLAEECGICDARTQLEVQGYSAWLQGTVLFELAEWTNKWEAPVEFFNKARAVYSKLLEAVTENESEVYQSRIQELDVKLRYCRHHLGDKAATDKLLAMRANEALGTKLDNLVAATREKQAATLSEVTWRGRKLAVQHEKVRMFLLNEGLIHGELSKISDAEERVEMLDTLLMECKDAMQIIREDLKNDPNFKARQQPSAGTVSPLHFLHTYLTFLRLNLTVLRNVALYRTYKAYLSGEKVVPNGKKAPKFQDVIRLFDLIIQSLNEIPNLAGLEEDQTLKQHIEGEVLSYKAHRCFCVAEMCFKLEKWAEAVVLYERALKIIEETSKYELKDALKAETDTLKLELNENKFIAHAKLVILKKEEEKGLNTASSKTSKMLIDQLDEYCEDPGIIESPRLVSLPPPMECVPCKPLFFDLALNYIEYPNLEEMITGKKPPLKEDTAVGGLTGLMKGLWGWGSKK